ncbi:acyltransferase [Geomonas nitrogeniifigens]|uniref:Acyltransferase n=1 Tax=Geomonas diazotrophica TaxID=2843197 RepID=A0ABX8JEX7_9BACT|nr:acyltransferase [Geomonas nitrogeniifigens]QWV96546.1 acyltransferase [Geomonas nitrogeniifigens]QXE85651.1 acyltransferase [Geomonas nitrogeniifigens]
MSGRIMQRILGKLAMISPGGYSLRPWLHKVRGVRMGKNVWISQLVYLDDQHPEKIEIGDNVTIGLGCTVFAHFYLGDRSPEDARTGVVIGNDVFIGPNCTILEGVTIGEGAVVVAGSVITRNVPPGVLYGPPAAEPLARITQPLTENGQVQYQKFLFGLKKL